MADSTFGQTSSARDRSIRKRTSAWGLLFARNQAGVGPRPCNSCPVSAGPRGTSLEVVIDAMRKRIRVLLFAALVAAIIVPVGFALSLESGERSVTAVHGIVPVAQIRTMNSPIVATTAAAVTSMPEVPEGAKLLVIGTALFGLAAAMRWSSKPDA